MCMKQLYVYVYMHETVCVYNGIKIKMSNGFKTRTFLLILYCYLLIFLE